MSLTMEIMNTTQAAVTAQAQENVLSRRRCNRQRVKQSTHFGLRFSNTTANGPVGPEPTQKTS